MMFMNKKDEIKKLINIRLNEQENEKLERYSALCGLSQTEFIRQLCREATPKPQPEKKFCQLLDCIYEIHAAFETCIPYCPEADGECRKIEQFILKLQEEI